MQTPQHTDQMDADDVAAIDELGEVYRDLKNTLHQIIIGQEQVIENLAICLFSQGHALLMGVPGLAKTLLVSCFADTMALSFRRIQFTPDLMPMDITGTDILQEIPGGKREFEFVKGPLFANLILADEINRAPSKTQAAMLEAMQEHKITVIGRTYQLDPPFFVLATQNPIEQEGTYPLPEAQLDRFMFRIEVDYPNRVEEIEIARTTTGMSLPTLDHVITGEQVMAFQNLVRRVPVPEHIFEFAVDLARSTRPKGDAAPEWLKPLVAWGAGPRAVQYLILGAKARAALSGSYMARLEDIIAVANPVLGHRVITSFAAESENITSGDIVDRLVEELSEN
ncbi:AAA family ATPase [Candidatus Poribacteria bacterium]|nr:MAG: AAA family ATPase [Candidatus Poribacteria bacterium]